jgi:hypothetical protein
MPIPTAIPDYSSSSGLSLALLSGGGKHLIEHRRRLFAVVVPIGKFGGVARQVLPADVDVRALDAVLEARPKAFDAVGVPRAAPVLALAARSSSSVTVEVSKPLGIAFQKRVASPFYPVPFYP